MTFSKLNKNNFTWLNSHRKILDIFTAHGHEGRFVGGVVKNSLIGQTLNDFDIAVTMQPNEVMTTLSNEGARVIPTGLQHGTVTAIYENTAYEITTLRRDVTTDGRIISMV
jgi:poly(A) polymerase